MSYSFKTAGPASAKPRTADALTNQIATWLNRVVGAL